MKKRTTSDGAIASASDIDGMVRQAWEEVGASFEHFCMMAGISSLRQMMAEDVAKLAGQRHERNSDRPGYRWGTTTGMVGFHGGKIPVERPRVRDKATRRECPLPSWQEACDGGFFEQWATSLMLMNVSSRKFRTAVRLPQAAVPDGAGCGLSRSAVSRRFKALTEARFMEWMSSDLSKLDLLVIQIDGLHMRNDLLMVGAIGIDSSGNKHPLGVVEGATENRAVVQALLDNLIERGLDPEVCRLFVVDGARALSGAIRRSFGAETPIQRCQVHKGRNVVERLPRHLHAGVRRSLRQAWELEDPAKAERLLRNLARRLEADAPGVTVSRLGLPPELRRSLACTNMIESVYSVVRQVCRNVKRWRDARMALRWTGAGMLEAQKGLRRIKAYRQLPDLKAALETHRNRSKNDTVIDRQKKAAQ